MAIESEVTTEEEKTQKCHKTYSLIWKSTFIPTKTKKASTKDETDSKRAARQEVNLFVF